MIGLFFAGFSYGFCTMLAFCYLILLMGVTYDEHVTRLVPDEDDSLNAFLAIIKLIGFVRCAIVFIVWPVLICFLIILYLFYGNVYFVNIHPYLQRILLWVFLGFGKFKPAIEKEAPHP